MTYFFSGIKHSGKSTHARLFAEYKNLPFYDLDKLIEDNIKYNSVRELYESEGKEAFMNQEFLSLKNLLQNNTESKVIALGGGICDNQMAFSLCNNLIYLDLEEKVLLNRIKYNGLPIFLKDQPAVQFHTLFEKRERLYKEKAKLIIYLKDESIQKVFDTIKDSLDNWEK
jgi:shikimate kinase